MTDHCDNTPQVFCTRTPGHTGLHTDGHNVWNSRGEMLDGDNFAVPLDGSEPVEVISVHRNQSDTRWYYEVDHPEWGHTVGPARYVHEWSARDAAEGWIYMQKMRAEDAA